MSGLTAVPPASERGRLVVVKHVVERIAEQAAFEVTHGREQRGAFAVIPGGDAGGRLRVDAELDGAVVWLRVDVALSYPSPLRAATDELRHHVVARVESLAGVTVRRLDIRVGWLVATTSQPRKLS